MIIGKRIYLRKLSLKDASLDYLSWVNNKKITKYMDIGKKRYTLKYLKNYITKSNKANNEKLFGIFLRDKRKHIGNMKIEEINYKHKRAYIGIMIGDVNEWGKGYATESIKLITGFSFKNLKLNKLKAGIVSINIGSIELFKKAGFKLEAKLIKDCLIGNKYFDSYIFTKFK